MPKFIYASTKNSDMFYAVHMNLSDPIFYVDTDKNKYVFLDHREYGIFKERNKNSQIELVLLDPLVIEARKMRDKTSEFNKLALYLLWYYDLDKQPLEVPSIFPLDMADFLRSKGAKLIPKVPFWPERLKKTKDEVAAIRASLLKTQDAFRFVEGVLKEAKIKGKYLVYKGEKLTSEFLRKEAARVLLENGMLSMEGLIVSCGAEAAIPHHEGHGPIRPHETIVCDIFPKSIETGYFADMTRTYVKGEPSPAIRKMYDAVLASQEAGIKAAKAGISGKKLHYICSRVFDKLGYDTGDKGFIHGTGHGLGLDVHEEPFASASSTAVLQAGNVITIEPGLYYPEFGGVRIEDVVLITENGCENLTNYHKNYIVP